MQHILLVQFPQGVTTSEAAVISLGRALVLAGARLLEVAPRELDARAKPASRNSFELIVYDAAVGGAGHCLELFNSGDEWLRSAENLLRGPQDHQRRCLRACLDCILDFSGQFHAAKLDRRAAIRLVDELRTTAS